MDSRALTLETRCPSDALKNADIEAGGLLRYLLVEAAQSDCRYEPELKQDYKRAAFRHGWVKARVAVARKLAIRLYIMLRDEIDYAEFVRRGSSAGMPGVALV